MTRKFDAYCIVEQLRLRQTCAGAQFRQSLYCWLTKKIWQMVKAQTNLKTVAPLVSCACLFREWLAFVNFYWYGFYPNLWKTWRLWFLNCHFPILDGDVLRSTSYGVYISQLIRFARASSHVADFNTRNKLLIRNFLNKAIGIINFTKPFLILETLLWSDI